MIDITTSPVIEIIELSFDQNDGDIALTSNQTIESIDLSVEDSASLSLQIQAIALSTAHVGADELRGAFLSAYSTAYKEFTYSGNKVTNIDIWTDASKTVQIFAKTITYTGDNVTKITTTNSISGQVLTKVLAYSGSDVISITESIT